MESASGTPEEPTAAAGAATGRGTPPLPSIPSLSGGDWPAQAADAIVDVVDRVRDRTTVPIMRLARATVFGVFIGTFVIVLCALLVIGLIRLLDEILPSGVWLPYLLLGALVTGLGWMLFRKRDDATVGNDRGR